MINCLSIIDDYTINDTHPESATDSEYREAIVFAKCKP